MPAFTRARRHVATRPGEALSDLAGLAALCAMIVAAFTLPGLV